MNIYIDFDDCLCETAKYFVNLVKNMYGKTVPYEDIRFFELQKSFDLTESQYEEMMIEAHKPEALLSFKETVGAVDTVNGWLDKGYNVSIITGRPSIAYEASREWLDVHGLNRVKLYCLNKYGRDSFIKGSEFNLELEDYYKMSFDYAIEDSPAAFKFFEHMKDIKVMVIDRPWNKGCELPNNNYKRCYDWNTIREIVKKPDSKPF
ncbi:MAG: 2-dehydropantoate 2-reductase [Lachnospiraceae bacterium]|nr:2-dehydropantoate 2-reductase [Lachnospiraceae bacterium]